MAKQGMPAESGKAVIAALERAGWVRVKSGGGSHVKLRRPGRPGHVTIPAHGPHDLPTGTLKSILDQAGLTADELRGLL